MVYVCSAGAHSINSLSKGTYIHCRKRTAIHGKTVNMAEHKRKEYACPKVQKKEYNSFKEWTECKSKTLSVPFRYTERLFQVHILSGKAPGTTCDVCSHRGSVRDSIYCIHCSTRIHSISTLY